MGLERQLLMPETGKAGKSTQAVMELCAYLNPGYVLPEKINVSDFLFVNSCAFLSRKRYDKLLRRGK